jgi:tetratricopeptide (TPR) repeat protein
MKVRSVTIAFVSSVFLAALGANSGSALASSSSANPLTVEAYTALAGGDSAKAISLYSQAIESRELAPELLANALLNRALAYQQMKKQGLAIDDYTAALSLDAMSGELRATALYNRGLSQHKIGKLPLAIEDFTSALLLNPSFAHAFLSRGTALRESGQYLFALSDFERALKFNHPDPARVYFGEAQTYDLLRRPLDAKRMLEAALGANPSFAPALEKLAAMESSPSTAVQTADASNDPILTGSISAAGGNTLVHKPDVPKGVEPSALLIEAASASNNTEVSATATAVEPKQITERVPQAESVAPTVLAAADEAAPEKVIAVESVPAIPPVAKKGTKVAAKIVEPAPAPEPETTASVSPAAAPASGWTVQIASAASEDAAWSTWKNMQKKFKVLSGQSPVVMKADLGAKGIFYRVRFAGFEDQTGAQSACSKLKSKGVSCFVSKAAS